MGGIGEIIQLAQSFLEEVYFGLLLGFVEQRNTKGNKHII